MKLIFRLTSLYLLIQGLILSSVFTANAQSLPNSNFSMSNVGSGWSEPVGVAFSKTGSKLFVWEKGGKVYLLNRVGTTSNYTKQTTPLLDISAEVGNWRDHGLLGFALDPNFDVNGLFYVLYVVDRHHLMYSGTGSYNANTNDYYKATIGRVTRYKTKTSGSNIIADLTTRAILIGETRQTGIPILHESHGVGSLAFAADGTLLVSAGDAASYNTVDVGSLSETYYAQAITDGIIRSNENVGSMRSQMINSHCGKLLRIDPTNGNGISNNPFYQSSSPRSAQSRVWALGFRNPFRIAVRPNTGSTNPATGDLGEVYIVDVGWDKYEEMNVVKAKATNCGWPIMEGISWQAGYAASTVQNRDEVNPLYGSGGCSQQYFQFRQLLRQANLSNSTTITNPCNSSVTISSPAPNRFLHRVPVLDWKHGEDSARVSYYNGSTLRVAQIGSANSGVTGTPFQGASGSAGCWYTGNLFPSMYKNSFFISDYVGGWIKNVVMLSVDRVEEVRDFSNSGFGAVVCMAENPADGSVFCADIGMGTIVRIGYGGNQPPVVKMGSNKTYGAAPLAVNFNSTGSYDPEGGAITYSWNWGDGTTAGTAANPSHTFTTSNSSPKKFTVILTVRDAQGLTSMDSIIISANNTPPVVNITSPVKGSFYQLGADTSYKLQATVTDAQHNASQLKYEWQVALRHNTHQHVEPKDTTRLTSAIISRIGCNGDTYYWFVKLTVTDAAGLSTIDSSRIYPQCGGPLPVTLTSFNATARGSTNVLNWATSSEINLRMFEIERSYDGINFETIGGVNANRPSGEGHYEWLDDNHDNGYNYYRLRMVDFSGYYKYSNIAKVFSGIITGNELVVSPNPAKDHVVYGAKFSNAGTISVRLVNSSGAVVKKLQEKVTAGFNSFRIDGLQRLPSGLYILEVIEGGSSRKSRLLLAH